MRWTKAVEAPRLRRAIATIVVLGSLGITIATSWWYAGRADPDRRSAREVREVALQQGQLRWLAYLALSSPHGVARGCVDRDLLHDVAGEPLVDLWGRDIAFACRLDAKAIEVTLTSSGPDLAPNTPDDIHVGDRVDRP